jgi:hypothetical protein
VEQAVGNSANTNRFNGAATSKKEKKEFFLRNRENLINFTLLGN